MALRESISTKNPNPHPIRTPRRRGEPQHRNSLAASHPGEDAALNAPVINDTARESLSIFAQDLAREFNDAASLRSTTSRLVNLYHQADLPMEDFIGHLYAARSVTKERSAVIRTSTPRQRRCANLLPSTIPIHLHRRISGHGSGASRSAPAHLDASRDCWRSQTVDLPVSSSGR